MIAIISHWSRQFGKHLQFQLDSWPIEFLLASFQGRSWYIILPQVCWKWIYSIWSPRNRPRLAIFVDIQVDHDFIEGHLSKHSASGNFGNTNQMEMQIVVYNYIINIYINSPLMTTMLSIHWDCCKIIRQGQAELVIFDHIDRLTSFQWAPWSATFTFLAVPESSFWFAPAIDAWGQPSPEQVSGSCQGFWKLRLFGKCCEKTMSHLEYIVTWQAIWNKVNRFYLTESWIISTTMTTAFNQPSSS